MNYTPKRWQELLLTVPNMYDQIPAYVEQLLTGPIVYTVIT